MTIVSLDFHVRTGYRDLMRDPAVAGAMGQLLAEIVERAGPGFEAELESRSGRREVPRGSVRTATFEARRRQAADHVLERSLS